MKMKEKRTKWDWKRVRESILFSQFALRGLRLADFDSCRRTRNNAASQRRPSPIPKRRDGAIVAVNKIRIPFNFRWHRSRNEHMKIIWNAPDATTSALSLDEHFLFWLLVALFLLARSLFAHFFLCFASALVRNDLNGKGLKRTKFMTFQSRWNSFWWLN